MHRYRYYSTTAANATLTAAKDAYNAANVGHFTWDILYRCPRDLPFRQFEGDRGWLEGFECRGERFCCWPVFLADSCPLIPDRLASSFLTVCVCFVHRIQSLRPVSHFLLQLLDTDWITHWHLATMVHSRDHESAQLFSNFICSILRQPLHHVSCLSHPIARLACSLANLSFFLMLPAITTRTSPAISYTLPLKLPLHTNLCFLMDEVDSSLAQNDPVHLKRLHCLTLTFC